VLKDAVTKPTKRKPPAAGIGRKKGVPNKLTRAAKEAFGLAFEGIGGVPALIKWGKANRTEFYKLYARLIPTEAHVSNPDGTPLNFVLSVPPKAE
jgi:hypothetical protein